MRNTFERKVIATLNSEMIELLISRQNQQFDTSLLDENQNVELLHLSKERVLLNINNKIREFYISGNGESFTITTGNKQIAANIDDEFIYTQKQKSTHSSQDNHAKNLLSPMPGLIIDVLISTGDLVKKGDPLLILEAMKMENIIKAPSDSCIKNILVKKNQSVEKDQLIIEFED